jgi:hypothetical protein
LEITVEPFASLPASAVEVEAGHVAITRGMTDVRVLGLSD